MILGPIFGTGLHAIGGMAASTCYTPFEKTKQWSWVSFWLVQAVFAWLLVPLILGILTVPDFFTILQNSSPNVVLGAFLLGGLYGFGGMSFGMAITHIGYSLTYTISIGISAVLGTIIPLMINGKLVEYFSKPGADIVLGGMLLSIIGVIVCGWAGFRKDKELGGTTNFNMATGLILTIIAGVLSAVFNISLEFGQPIADMAADKGAGVFEGNAKLIVSTAGCFVVNVVWFTVLGFKRNTFKEMMPNNGLGNGDLVKNYTLSGLAGTLWCMQFFFYGLGHVNMGDFQFISWVLHMSMLIFFSFLVGVFMKEWKEVSKSTFRLLIIALAVLCISFVIITYGSTNGVA
ncbi:hypothetical protein NC796_08560 [Aliifodinibius sp. S!AR15-10]|uniref:L-rhamnose/proton symporter RhaT n=1 Tax=Aliifodinibius sp. S!AR15-10 TaxID=2950437 RepID=UPI002864A559|nr:L-rhamnose/proton symporter RhaT [Aliifodinibius sp. S!AR15-10]MDR8391186.1 hypothetical protein [Aliifodinibius sp. S!AR15-10]